MCRINVGQSECLAKDQLLSDIDSFIQERIEFADEVIATHGVSKINDGDVILTYATSHVVELLLARAAAEGKRFRLIIVDSRPKLEGKELLRRLLQRGVNCTYIMINALSYVMRDVSKVFLGAAALLSNGAVISRVGSAVVAMMAKCHNVPVLVCCETYKFHERVQLDSIGFNELGDPDELILNEQDAPTYGHMHTSTHHAPRTSTTHSRAHSWAGRRQRLRTPHARDLCWLHKYVCAHLTCAAMCCPCCVCVCAVTVCLSGATCPT